jgi:NADPH-dependent F420 reductase
MSKIAIIGTGRMGQNLAKGWLKTGHKVTLGSRQPEQKQDILNEVPGVTITDFETALAGTEVVVIAIPYGEVESFARAHAAQLRDKPVIDITNPFDKLPDNRVAGAEITARAIGEGARVVAAFKDNFWSTLHEPIDPKTNLVRDVHFAGDNETDKEMVTQLIGDLGFEPVDCGPLSNARILDGMVTLMIELDRRYTDGGFHTSWKLMT